jgi:hypothetical protein
MTNRAGFRYIGACKTTSITVMLMRYVSETPGNSLLLEVGNGYIRFYLNGAPLNVVLGSIAPYNGATNYVIGDLVQSGGVVFYALVDNVGVATANPATWYPFPGTLFELPNPFGADLPRWVQSSRTITLTHKSHAPYELINGGTVTQLGAAAGQYRDDDRRADRLRGGAGRRPARARSATSSRPRRKTRTKNRSVGASDSCGDRGADAGCAGRVDVDAGRRGRREQRLLRPVRQRHLRLHRHGDREHRHVQGDGARSGLHDHAAAADDVVRGGERLPELAAYFQQRRFFAYTNTNPDAIYGSRTGFASNFGVSQPLQDDDALSFKIAGNNHNPIRHLLALKQLVVLTDAGEWTVSGSTALGSSIASRSRRTTSSRSSRPTSAPGRRCR